MCTSSFPFLGGKEICCGNILTHTCSRTFMSSFASEALTLHMEKGIVTLGLKERFLTIGP